VHRHGLGPRLVINKYNLRSSVHPYLTRALGHSGISCVTMPPTTGSGSRKETCLAMDDVVHRLDRLEELVRAVTGDLRDVKAQQTTLGVPHPPRTVGVGAT
jgi:hypothetical protein